jgi:adenine-specific DNA-methyltransferase
VFEMNSRTGLSSPVILVQIPESLEGNLSSAKGAAKKTIQNAIAFLDDLGKPTTIAELAKIRLERAGNRILAAGTAKGTSPDVGYRTFRTDSTNFADVSVPPDALTVDGLLAQASNLKTDREAEDLLVEVLLQWGLELSMQFSTESVRGSDIWVIEDGALVACFNEEVDADVIREIAGRAPLRAVFRDSGFRSDEDRLNAEQIFKEVSPATDVKVI